MNHEKVVMLNEVKHLWKPFKRREGFFAPLRMTFRDLLVIDSSPYAFLS